MSRLGAFEIPEMPLSAAGEVVRRAHRAYGASFSRESLSGILQLKGRGGWFAAVLSSLRSWGLAEGRGTVRLTPTGMRIAGAGAGRELGDAYAAAMMTLPLIVEIVRRSPDSIPARTDLALMVADITGADAGRVHAALPQIQRILGDAWRSSGRGRGREVPDPEVPDSDRAGTRGGAGATNGSLPAASRSGLELSFSGGRLSLPETPENLHMAAELLRRRAAQLMESPTD